MLSTRVLIQRLGAPQSRSASTKAKPKKTAAPSTPVIPRVVTAHEHRVKRNTILKEKESKMSTLNPTLADYFKMKPIKRKTKINKSAALIDPYIDINKPKVSPDETTLTNAEYLKAGIHKEVEYAAQIWEICPQLFPSFKPSINLIVTHDGTHSIFRGNFYQSVKVRSKPEIRYETNKPNAFYTLMMVDPDIPLKSTKFDFWNHYMVTNIPGNKVAEGQVLADWIPSAPPADTGIHRYIWLLMEQSSGKTDFSSEATLSNTNFNRVFNFDEFVQKYKLKPTGMCFYRTQYDKDVQELWDNWGATLPSFNIKDYRTQLKITQKQYNSM